MHNSKIAVAFFAVLGITSCFLPWAHRMYFGESSVVRGIYFSEGIFCLIYFTLMLTFCFFDSRKAAVPGKLCLGMALTTPVPAFLMAYHYFVTSAQATRMREFNADLTDAVITSPANGVITGLVAISGIAMVFLGVVVYNHRHVFMPPSTLKPATANYAVAS